VLWQVDLNMTGSLDMYIDGADEVNPNLQLIKGGGGALTREKIIAAASNVFICIVDDSKVVDVLGISRSPQNRQRQSNSGLSRPAYPRP